MSSIRNDGESTWDWRVRQAREVPYYLKCWFALGCFLCITPFLPSVFVVPASAPTIFCKMVDAGPRPSTPIKKETSKTGEQLEVMQEFAEEHEGDGYWCEFKNAGAYVTLTCTRGQEIQTSVIDY